MGLENREKGQYINIYNGKFSMRVPEGTSGSVTRLNKENRTVHEMYYDSFTAKLIGIRVQEGGPYGSSWIFDFQDKGDVYHLQLSYSNSLAKAFLKMLPNIDLNKQMKVQPAIKLGDDGKPKSSLFVSQEGVTIKHAYTKDNPNGLPPMEQFKVKGVITWDDTKQIEFLQAMVMKDIVPKLPKASAISNEPATGLEVSNSNDGNDFDSVVNDLNGVSNTDEEPF